MMDLMIPIDDIEISTMNQQTLLLTRPNNTEPSAKRLFLDVNSGVAIPSPLLNAVPPLTRGTSMASSASGSIDTDLASSILGDGYVLESQDGVLTMPLRYQEDANLLCPFQILDCQKVFADIVPFKMHVFSHFRGHELPTMAACFLCDNKYFQRPEDDSALAWNNMLSHMAHDHFRKGQRLATVRTDFALMRWMFSKRIISHSQFSRAQLPATPIILPGSARRRREIADRLELPTAPSAPTPPAILAHLASVGHQNEPYTVNSGARADRRRLEATGSTIRTSSLM